MASDLEFAVFREEALEWAELNLPTALENWPDYDWPGEEAKCDGE